MTDSKQPGDFPKIAEYLDSKDGKMKAGQMEVFVCATIQERLQLQELSEHNRPHKGDRGCAKCELLCNLQVTIHLRYMQLACFDGIVRELVPVWARRKQQEWLKKYGSQQLARINFFLDQLDASELVQIEAMDIRSKQWMVPKFLDDAALLEPPEADLFEINRPIPDSKQLEILQRFMPLYLDLSKLRRGDTVWFADYGGYRNSGKSLWDGQKLIALDTDQNEYGSAPRSLPISEFGVADFFAPTVCHNRFIHFNPQGFIDRHSLQIHGKLFAAEIMEEKTRTIWYIVGKSAKSLAIALEAFPKQTLYEYLLNDEVPDWNPKRCIHSMAGGKRWADEIQDCEELKDIKRE